jgi:hypothetical protein
MVQDNENQLANQVRDEINKEVTAKVKADKDFIDDKPGQDKLKNNVVKKVTADSNKQLKVDMINQIAQWQKNN